MTSALQTIRPGSGEPKDFDVKIAGTGHICFTVRTGDGAPYDVYLRPERAQELQRALAAFFAPSSSPLHALRVTKAVRAYLKADVCGEDEFAAAALEELLTAVSELEATLTAAPQTPEKKLTRYRLINGASGPELCSDGVDHPYAGPLVYLVSDVEAQAGPSDPEKSNHLPSCEFSRPRDPGLETPPRRCTCALREARPLPSSLEKEPKVKVYGAGSSYTYLEGSHGCDRCNWCHADNVGTTPGTPFPHKKDCPTLTIKALSDALSDAEANLVPPSAPPPPRDWQPIETAPCLTDMLLWARGWRSPFVGKVLGDFGHVLIDGSPAFEMYGATHWMPLPSAPDPPSPA